MMTDTTRIELEGHVCPGRGEAAGFTSLEWVIVEFRKALGFIPWPGTFNLRMRGASWDRARRRLRATAGIPIAPRAGFCAAKCFGVHIAGHLTGAVVFPAMPDYPDDKFEIVAPLPIRETLGLQDGDLVNLSLDLATSARRGGLPA
ncbi:DUF120 domain-containing protein [Azoarcus sp. KH32C]|uniref:DUF120 domain-containing protein n=1 Tax=Azoarcus sp. KH32C TaxID=748247 RepID=UPI0002385D5D|nr:DUF120 domain-containing protein [Azoarcus sp. KH32C]BAL27021.1 hypothetical protein AZKH_p0138 [Azoarcus sp. KH32C]